MTNNDRHGWGGEDDDLYYRLKHTQLLQSDNSIRRPPKGFGKYRCLTEGHTERVKDEQQYNNIIKQIRNLQQGSQQWKKDGLNNLNYKETRPRVTDKHGTLWVFVSHGKDGVGGATPPPKVDSASTRVLGSATENAAAVLGLLRERQSREHSFASKPAGSEGIPTLLDIKTADGLKWVLPEFSKFTIKWVVGDPPNIERSIMQLVLAVLRKRCSEDQYVIDIGMNEGMYTSVAAIAGCTVISMEPQTRCVDNFAAALQHPVNEHRSRIVVLNAAATERRTTMEVSVDACNGCYNVEGKAFCRRRRLLGGSKAVVDGLPPSEIIRAVGGAALLVHIDVEGFEVKPLRDILKSGVSVENIMVETNGLLNGQWAPGDNAELRSLMKGKGFRCWQLTGTPLQVRVLFWVA